MLIEPYRWIADPAWAWWLGTGLLCLWAVVVGDITYRVVSLINKRFVKERNQEMTSWQNRAMNALRAGNKEVYTGANKLATDAFGRSFFMQLAMGLSSLWPAFLGAAWLQLRFQGVPVLVPQTDWELRWLPVYVVMYILIRVSYSMLMKMTKGKELYSQKEINPTDDAAETATALPGSP